MQWLFGVKDNAQLQRYGGLFPILKPGEALLEGAYTLEKVRGLGVMAAAMAQIAEKGGDVGAHVIITFVEEDNIASLKGCKRSGFSVYLARDVRWLLFRRTVTFQELPVGTTYPFDAVQQSA